MISITLNFETLAEAHTALDRLQGAGAAKAEAAAVIKKASKAEVPAAEAPKPAPTQTAPETVTSPQATESVSTTPAAASPSEVTYQEVATLVVAHMKAHGKPAAVALLEGFNIKSLTAAKPDQYAAIKAKFEAVAA